MKIGGGVWFHESAEFMNSPTDTITPSRLCIALSEVVVTRWIQKTGQKWVVFVLNAMQFAFESSKHVNFRRIPQ